MATVLFGTLTPAAAPGVYQRGTTGGGTARAMFGIPPPVRLTYRYQARRVSDGATITWSSDGPDPTGIRAGAAIVSGSVSRLT